MALVSLQWICRGTNLPKKLERSQRVVNAEKRKGARTVWLLQTTVPAQYTKQDVRGYDKKQAC